MKLYAWTIFISAFLLFQVQPLIGKFILPWFGSTPGVWTTCLLFFQLLLLAGYAYAHLIVTWLAPRNQALVHVGLLVAASVTAYIAPKAGWKPIGDEEPIGRILLLLSVSVGLPYFVLSATGPLLQGWFARTYPGVSPYRLYALSNVGSLLALLSYPFVFERFLTLKYQARWWMFAYWAFALLCGWCAWVLMRAQEEEVSKAAFVEPVKLPVQSSADSVGRPSVFDMALWLLLAMCGSVMLVATTNQMCIDVAVVPFLWVVPLSIYLLTFIICFDSPDWYSRPVFCVALPIGVAGGCTAMIWGNGTYFDIQLSLPKQITLYSVALFCTCMSCHGELVRIKPAPRHLTLFYLFVSLGGALGGVLVGVVAPNAFNGVWEYHLGLFGSGLLVFIAIGRDVWRQRREERRSGTVHRALDWARASAIAAAGLGLVALGGVLALNIADWRFDEVVEVEQAELEDKSGDPAWLDDEEPKPEIEPQSYLGGSLLVDESSYTFLDRWKLKRGNRNLVDRRRNFYGVLRVEREIPHDDPDAELLNLTHGRINHGKQFRNAQMRLEPTSYYGRDSGVGHAIERHLDRKSKDGLRIGVVGLGTGTLAAYARPGDVVRFYEINPLVAQWSGLEGKYFSYLHDAKARGADVDIFMGDARIVMERQIDEDETQKFDVLAIDAFSSDAIPIHLLTREAFEIYWRHLRTSGILAVHISNKFLDLRPVVRRLAADCGKHAALFENEDGPNGIDGSSWVLVTSNKKFLEQSEIERAKKEWEDGLLWTDDFSSVFEIVERK